MTLYVYFREILILPASLVEDDTKRIERTEDFKALDILNVCILVTPGSATRRSCAALYNIQ